MAKKYSSRPLREYSRPIVFSDNLCIAKAREEIITAWKRSQVLLIQSETGSGKSTQIPKIALSSFPMREGELIGITQPRRLATQVLANRLSHELGAPPGETIGWQVRHKNCTLPKHFIKVMTEGILVQEAAHDPLLSKYKVIILDEVHERSIHVDLLCGLLKQILPLRPDLKIALLSATLEKEVFLNFFPKAESLFFAGRCFPITDFYWEGAIDVQIEERLIWAIDAIEHMDSGNILVFCATEAQIHNFRGFLEHARPQWEYHMLYSRLNPLKQQAATRGTGPKRRIILSTNIAETSITIPGLSAVIDLGTQKIMLFNPQLRVNSYPIVPITQSSIAQRRGRAGRTRPGVCFHLYTEEDSLSRPADRVPEILRSSLSHVLLKILMIGQKSIRDFPFISPPHSAQMREALQTLELLNLINEEEQLTMKGRLIAHDPIDPRFSVILHEAKKLRVGFAVTVIIAFLSTNDPRLRPSDKKNLANKKHELDRDYRSDFLTILNLWKRVDNDTKALSKRKFQKYCEENFLQALFVDQWRSVTQELCNIMQVEWDDQSLEGELNSPLIHRALLAGFFDKIFQLQDDGLYRGGRGIIAKSSFIEKGAIKKPQWVLSISVETFSNEHRLRWVGPIEPTDVLTYGEKKLTYQLSNWSYCEQRRAVYLTETTLLWGLRVYGPKRRWATIEDKDARKVAIEGLVQQYYPLFFESIPSWHSAFKEAAWIAQRTQSAHLLRSPTEVITIALEQWPTCIWNGASLDTFSRAINIATVDLFFVGELPCTLADLPDQITVDMNPVEIHYTESEEKHIIEISLSEKLWKRYNPTAWISLHPFYRKQIVLEFLNRVPRSQRMKWKESTQNIAQFFLSEYTWPKDLLQELKKFLYQYFDFDFYNNTWTYSHISQGLIPTIWVESESGDLHWIGPIDTSLQKIDSQSRPSHDHISDLDQEIYHSYQSALYRTIDMSSKQEIVYSPQDKINWKTDLLYNYANTLSNGSLISYPGLLKNSDKLLAIQITLGIFLLPGPGFLLKNQSCRVQLKDSYMTFWKKNSHLIDEIITFIKKRKSLKTPAAVWAKNASDALVDGRFLAHLSKGLLLRVPLWIEAMAKIDTRNREKPAMCLAFHAEWELFLQQSQIKQRHNLSSSHPIWALWWEWMLAQIYQPIRPIIPLSLKKALLLCKETDDFQHPWP